MITNINKVVKEMIKIIYWSGTGNTQSMAELIANGLQQESSTVEIKQVSEATMEDIKDADILVLGCPAMGCEELEESEMEPFISSVEVQLSHKKIVLFGSYGWGGGEWMETWKEKMSSYGAELIIEPLIINESPQGEDEEKCMQYGKQIAQLV